MEEANTPSSVDRELDIEGEAEQPRRFEGLGTEVYERIRRQIQFTNGADRLCRQFVKPGERDGNGLHLSADERFACARGKLCCHQAILAEQRVGGEEDAACLGIHHLLDDDRHQQIGGPNLSLSRHEVGQAPCAVEGAIALLDPLTDGRDTREAEDTVVLTGEA